jgi:hypothetical protein
MLASKLVAQQSTYQTQAIGRMAAWPHGGMPRKTIGTSLPLVRWAAADPGGVAVSKVPRLWR